MCVLDEIWNYLVIFWRNQRCRNFITSGVDVAWMIIFSICFFANLILFAIFRHTGNKALGYFLCVYGPTFLLFFYWDFLKQKFRYLFPNQYRQHPREPQRIGISWVNHPLRNPPNVPPRTLTVTSRSLEAGSRGTCFSTSAPQQEVGHEERETPIPHVPPVQVYRPPRLRPTEVREVIYRNVSSTPPVVLLSSLQKKKLPKTRKMKKEEQQHFRRVQSTASPVTHTAVSFDDPRQPDVNISTPSATESRNAEISIELQSVVNYGASTSRAADELELSQWHPKHGVLTKKGSAKSQHLVDTLPKKDISVLVETSSGKICPSTKSSPRNAEGSPPSFLSKQESSESVTLEDSYEQFKGKHVSSKKVERPRSEDVRSLEMRENLATALASRRGSVPPTAETSFSVAGQERTSLFPIAPEKKETTSEKGGKPSAQEDMPLVHSKPQLKRKTGKGRKDERTVSLQQSPSKKMRHKKTDEKE